MLKTLFFIFIFSIKICFSSTTITITQQPTSLTTDEGYTAIFTIQATSPQTLSYIWYKNNIIITERIPYSLHGQGTHTLTIGAVDDSDSGSYYCRIYESDSLYEQTNTVSLYVRIPPKILSQPIDSTVVIGNSAVLQSTVSNIAADGAMIIEWYSIESNSIYTAVPLSASISVQNIVNQDNSVTSTLTFSPSQKTHQGYYIVIVSQTGLLKTISDTVQVNILAVPNNPPSFLDSDSLFPFHKFVDTDGRIGYLNGRVNFLRAANERIGEVAYSIKGYKLFWSTSTNVLGRFTSPFFTGSVGDWDPQWRSVPNSDLASVVCTTLHGTGSAVIENYKIKFVDLVDNGFPSLIRCDIPITTTFGSGIKGIKGNFTIQPIDSTTLKRQHPDNNQNISSWATICTSNKGFIAIGSENSIVDGGAVSGTDFRTNFMFDLAIDIPATNVVDSQFIRIQVCQSSKNSNLLISNISLQFTELGLTGRSLEGSSGSLVSFDFPSAVQITTQQYIHAVSFNEDGDGAFTSLPITDISFPEYSPTSLTILESDTNPYLYKYGTTLKIGRAIDESDIISYNIYFGTGNSETIDSKFPNIYVRPIASVMANSTDNILNDNDFIYITFKDKSFGNAFQTNQTVPTTLLVFSFGINGENSVGKSVVFEDIAFPENPPQSITLLSSDSNPQKGKINLSLRITPAEVGKDSDILEYKVYFGDKGTFAGEFTTYNKIPDILTPPLATVSAVSGQSITVNLADILVLWKSIDYYPSSGAVEYIPSYKASHILVFSSNADGEHPVGVGVSFEDLTCGSPLGLSTSSNSPFGYLSDSLLTASASAVSSPSFNGRLDGSPGGWCSSSSSVSNQWFQVTFPYLVDISAIAIQGTTDGFITQYSVSYQTSAGWNNYETTEGESILTGNVDTSSVVKILLSPSILNITAIRIIPVTYTTKICLRAEFYGCPSQKPTQTAQLTFQDDDQRAGYIQGTVRIIQPDILYPITHWALYLSYGRNSIVRASENPITSLIPVDFVGDSYPIVVTATIATELIAGATHLQVVACTGVGLDRSESENFFQLEIFDQVGPPSYPEIITFVDNDIQSNKIGGVITWSAVPNESMIDAYQVWFGVSALQKTGTVLSTITPSGTSYYHYTVASGTSYTGKTHFLVFTVSSSGDMNPSPAQVRIIDVVGPPNPVTSVEFEDLDTRSGFISGVVTFNPPIETYVTIEYFEIWFVINGTKVGNSYIGQCTVNDRSVTLSSVVIPSNFNSVLPTVTISVFSKGGGILGASTELSFIDLIGPKSIVITPQSSGDVNPLENLYSATLSWIKPLNDANIVSFSIWLGDASTNLTIGTEITSVLYSSANQSAVLTNIDITGATCFLIFSLDTYTNSNPTPAYIEIIDLIGSPYEVTELEFVDVNTTQYSLTGLINFTAPVDQDDIMFYEVWLGSDSKTILSNTLLANISQSGLLKYSTEITFEIFNTSATHLIIRSLDINWLHSSLYSSLLFSDLIGPPYSPYNVRFNNTATTSTIVTGIVSWKPANPDTDVARYEVWLGTSRTSTSGLALASVSNNAAYMSVRINANRASTVTHILVFSVDSNGTKNPNPGFYRISTDTTVFVPVAGSIELNGSSMIIGARSGPPYPNSCSQAKSMTYLSTTYSLSSGYYIIQKDQSTSPTTVYCDMTSGGVQIG